MKLPELAIKNYQFTIILVLLLALIGVATFITMPRSEDPQNDVPGAAITIIYPGASPEDLEKMVIDPIEEELNELEDIKTLESKAFDGLATVDIEFLVGTDAEDKYRKVIEKMNAVEPKLPSEIYEINKRKYSVMDVSIFQLAFVSDDAEYRDLEKQAKNLKKEVEKLYGVKKAEVLAAPDQEISISADFERLAQYNISIGQLMQVIQSTNANIPGGNLKLGDKSLNILTSGEYESLEEIRNTVIHESHGKYIRLKDVADVSMEYDLDKYLARYNQEKAIFLNVTQKKGTNIYTINNKLQPVLEDFKAQLPENIRIETVLNQSDMVRARIDDFFINYIQGIILVGLLILIALGIRSSIVIIIAIPLSALIGLTLLDLSNYGLQQISIAGLIIALGLLVDNSIAIVENIHRYLNMGYSRVNAAIQGTKEIGWALVSSTVTTVMAFIPIAAIGGGTGDFIRSMAMVVMYTLIASLVIALTFTPYLSSVILKLKSNKKENHFIKDWIDKHYQQFVLKAIKRPWLTVSFAIIMFVGSLALFGLIGVSFFPNAEKPQLLIDIKTPDGSSFERTDEAVRFVENTLSQENEVQKYASNIGRGNPQVYYNIFTPSYSKTRGQVFAILDEYDNEKMPAFVSKLRGIFDQYPGADIEVKEFIQGPPVEAPIAIKVIGNDINKLKEISKEVEKIVSNTDYIVNVNNPLNSDVTNLKVDIDPLRAGMFGVNMRDIDIAIKTTISGTEVGTYRDDEGEEYDIMVKNKHHKQPDIYSFKTIYLPNNNGSQVPLSQVADLEFSSTLKQLNHFRMDRQNTITADLTDVGMVTPVTLEIMEKLKDYELPPGFRFYAGGQIEHQTESFGSLGKVVLAALIGIFAVLVLQFRSFTQPLIIYTAIPMAITGAFIALFVTGQTFSFMASVGLTSLIGIVVNDSIILVDYANQLRRNGAGLIDAVVEAGKTRFMPIILTTVTTIGGLLPLTLKGGDMWAPMGWSIIGGLLFSTILCLVIVPVLYKLYSKKDIARI